MVFGHYSIPIKTVEGREIPPQLSPGPGAKYQLIIRVFHIMWIPIFPFAKMWVLSRDGNKYELDARYRKNLDRAFGRRSTPWYAFAGPILIFGFPLIGGIGALLFGGLGDSFTRSNKKVPYTATIEKQLNEKRDKINNPSSDDYYWITYLDADNRTASTTLKVDRFTADSILFSVPTTTNQISWSSDAYKVGYFVNENAFVKPLMLAKADLLSSIDEQEADPNAKYYFPISGLLDDARLNISTIKRIEKSAVNPIFKDELIEPDVRAAFNTFMDKQTNIDSSLLLIDSSSIAYFDQILELAQADNSEKAIDFAKTSAYPEITYKFMLYTILSYLRTDEETQKLSKAEKRQNHAFYLKLLDLGLWLLDFDRAVIGKTNIRQITFSSSTEAQISLTAPSNSLTRVQNISFTVDMVYENDEWKVNVPSTLSYTRKQIGIGIQGYDKQKVYREMVRDDLKKLDEKIVVPSEWVY